MWIEDADEPAMMRSAAEVFLRYAKAAKSQRERQTFLAHAQINRELAADLDRNRAQAVSPVSIEHFRAQKTRRDRVVQPFRPVSTVILAKPHHPALLPGAAVKDILPPRQDVPRADRLDGFRPVPDAALEVAADGGLSQS
jgi:hypothetical protein